jgi:hypothetical protein
MPTGDNTTEQNRIPTKIKQLGSFMDFKQKLNLFLLDHPFESLNELLCLKKVVESIINNTNKII